MKKILITAFEPFGENTINPTTEILKEIDDTYNNIVIVKKNLPVIYDKCFKILKPLIDSENPDYILCMGLAGGRKNICIERVAINIQNAAIADNDGNKFEGKLINKNGNVGYFTNLPFEKLKKIDSRIDYSFSAGTYICNNIFYLLMEYIEKHNSKIKGGFIHIPYTEYFKKEPYICLKDQIIIINKMIKVLGEV